MPSWTQYLIRDLPLLSDDMRSQLLQDYVYRRLLIRRKCLIGKGY